MFGLFKKQNESSNTILLTTCVRMLDVFIDQWKKEDRRILNCTGDGQKKFDYLKSLAKNIFYTLTVMQENDSELCRGYIRRNKKILIEVKDFYMTYK